jgi:hypothetical protein
MRQHSSVIEPDVRISRIRLSDWLHRKAHGPKLLTASGIWQESRHPHRHFRGLLSFTHVMGRLIVQPPTGDLCHEVSTHAVPAQAARQLPDQSTTLRVASSSTGDSRLRGALPDSDMTGVKAFAYYLPTSSVVACEVPATRDLVRAFCTKTIGVASTHASGQLSQLS